MNRAYYSSSINNFLDKNEYEIFGEITVNDQFSAEDLQRILGKKIEILKESFLIFPKAIYFSVYNS